MLLKLAASKVRLAITDELQFAVLHNTWRFGGVPVGHRLVDFG